MIHFVSRNQLDENKYNACVENSKQSRVFAFSWYLDIVAGNWSVLVLNDYEAVMPIPTRKKYGIKYVYPPFWVLELGVFFKSKVNIDQFISTLNNTFWFIETRLNTLNPVQNKNLLVKELQYLEISFGYELLLKGYQKDKRKELRKAEIANLEGRWHQNPKELIDLFRDNVGQRTPNILSGDYEILKALIIKCLSLNIGKLLSVFDSEKKLVASGFFLIYNGRVTLLVSSTDFLNRNNGANTYLIDCALRKFSKDNQTFHFGGSSIVSVANYFKGFGAKTETYSLFRKRLL